MKKLQKILIDLDGIMVELLPKWLQRHNDVAGKSIQPEEVTAWDFKGCDVNRDVLFACLGERDLFRDLPEVPGAIEGVRSLIDYGHDVSFVSVAPCSDAAVHKWNWRDRFFPDVPIRIYSSGLCKSELAADVLIDDCPDTQRAAAARGMDVLSLPYPWIRGVSVKIIPSWEDIVTYLCSSEVATGANEDVLRRMIADRDQVIARLSKCD